MAIRIGIIGGSGLYQMDGLEDVREERVDTPFGAPSDAVITGRLRLPDGSYADLAFLPRHGRGHRFTPTTVPYRANIYALKSLGCGWIISVSAVGSLQDGIVPGDVVIVDQFVDKTKHRAHSFFDSGIVAHVGFGDPVCPALRGYLLAAARDTVAADPSTKARVHDGGTYVVMEGPAFSTRAESLLHRGWGASVIGMTNLPEAYLAREAEISYATIALATDYDCWHPHHDAVTVDQVVAVLTANVDLARRIVKGAIPRIAAHAGEPPMAHALRHAIMTAPEAVDPEKRRSLDLLVRKYLR